STEDSSDEGLDQLDPGTMLARLTSGGRTLSTSRVGDRTVFRLRVPSKLVFETGDGSQPIDVRVEADADGRVRSLSTAEGQPATGSVKITVTFDDFGVDVDVRPPPANQVVEKPVTSSSPSVGESSGSVQLDSGQTGFGTAAPMSPQQACQ